MANFPTILCAEKFKMVALEPGDYPVSTVRFENLKASRLLISTVPAQEKFRIEFNGLTDIDLKRLYNHWHDQNGTNLSFAMDERYYSMCLGPEWIKNARNRGLVWYYDEKPDFQESPHQNYHNYSAILVSD